MALRTVIYLRKSTQDKDEKQIHSILRQREDIFDFIERYNKSQQPEERLTFDPAKDIVEEDASAKKLGRPKFAEMVKSIQKNHYDVLLCTELSRLSRNAVDTGTLVQLLESEDKKPAHLKRIQTKDKVFSTTPTDKFTLALFLTVSKFENDQRAANTSSGMAHQKGKGVTTHKAPMGYINEGEKKGEKWVEADPLTWDNVKQIWEFFMTGNYSVPDLKREGDARGITVLEKSGKRHLPVESTYRVMLRSQYYAGFVKKVNKETSEVEWIKGKHPPMVTLEEFERVQLILQSRGYRHQPTKNSVSMDTIFNEILLCGKCSMKMVFESKTRYTCAQCKHRFSSAEKKPCPECGAAISEETKVDSHRYYRCGQRYSSEACVHDFYGDGNSVKNVRAEDIEKYIDKQVSALSISDKLYEVLRRQLYTLWLEANENIRLQKAGHRKQLTKLEEERIMIQRRALDKQKMTEVEREDHDNLLEANRRDQLALEEAVAGLKEDEEEKFEKAWQSLQVLREAKSVFGQPQIGFEPKRKLILSLCSNLKITDDKWEMIWKSPFDAVAKASIAKKGRPKSGSGSDDDKRNWLPRLDSNQ